MAIKISSISTLPTDLDSGDTGWIENHSGTLKTWNGSGWDTVPSPGIKASGGLINDYTSGGVDYRSHTFLSSGTFVVGPNALTNVEYLVIAGGGAGAGN